MVINELESKKIQLLRGLAIIAVVLIHNTPGRLAQVWCRPFINFSVGCFWFISGLLSNADRWNPIKRIKNVIIPYIIWTLIYIVIYIIERTPLHQMPVLFLKSLVVGNAAAIMYYIFVYCEFTLLIPLIDRLSKCKFKWLGFLISPMEIVIIWVFPLIGVYDTNKYINAIRDISCFGWFTYFYLGYMLGNGRIKNKISTVKLGILWCISIGLQILEGYWWMSMGETNCGTQLKLTANIIRLYFHADCI